MIAEVFPTKLVSQRLNKSAAGYLASGLLKIHEVN